MKDVGGGGMFYAWAVPYILNPTLKQVRTVPCTTNHNTVLRAYVVSSGKCSEPMHIGVGLSRLMVAFCLQVMS